MSRYVLLSREKEVRREDSEAVAREPGVTVIEEGVGRAILVEATEEAADRLREHLPGWIVSKETVHPRPAPPEHRILKRDADEPSE